MNIEFYEDILKVLDILAAKGTISDDEGKRIFGEGRWLNIYQWFAKATKNRFIIYSEGLDVREPAYIEATREICKSEIARIEEDKRSQRLADHNNLSGTLANWATFILAVWGALTGTIALVLELLKRS